MNIYTCEKFAEVIDHMIIKHPQDELRIRKLVENDPARRDKMIKGIGIQKVIEKQ